MKFDGYWLLAYTAFAVGAAVFTVLVANGVM